MDIDKVTLRVDTIVVGRFRFPFLSHRLILSTTYVSSLSRSLFPPSCDFLSCVSLPLCIIVKAHHVQSNAVDCDYPSCFNHCPLKLLVKVASRSFTLISVSFSQLSRWSYFLLRLFTFECEDCLIHVIERRVEVSMLKYLTIGPAMHNGNCFLFCETSVDFTTDT